MPTPLQLKQDEMTTKQKNVALLFKEKPNKDFTEDEVKFIQTTNAELGRLRDEIATLQEIDRIAEEVKNFEYEAEGDIPSGSSKGKGKGQDESKLVAVSMGEAFIGSKTFTEYNRSKQSSPSSDFYFKTVFSSQVGTPSFQPETFRNGILVEYPVRQPKMDLIIPQTRTNQREVVYLEETLWTNGAANVAEDDSTAGESTFEITEKTSPIRKIRVSLPVTDEMMEDAPFMQDYVNSRLLTQLALKKDTDMISGSGTAPQLRGLLNVVGIQTRAAAAGEYSPDTVHRAMTDVLLTSEYPANGIVMHPLNWETIRLSKTADGVYIYGNPTDEGSMKLWGLQVIDTKGMTANTALVGAFDAATSQVVRREVTMSVSTEHDQNFLKGRLTIKVEMRVGLVVYRPSALCKITGLV